MTSPTLKKLAAEMDRDPSLKTHVEATATPYVLGLLAKYREQRRPWWRRLLDKVRRS